MSGGGNTAVCPLMCLHISSGVLIPDYQTQVENASFPYNLWIFPWEDQTINTKSIGSTEFNCIEMVLCLL